MTVKRAKNVWHHQAAHNIIEKRRKNALASSYFSAAVIALMLAIVTLLIGIAAIGDGVESYFDEKPMINIVLPPEGIR